MKHKSVNAECAALSRIEPQAHAANRKKRAGLMNVSAFWQLILLAGGLSSSALAFAENFVTEAARPRYNLAKQNWREVT